MHSAISSADSRNEAGDHLSNFSEYSRTAASPRAPISARMASTVLRTCALLSAFASAVWPVLMWRIMKHSQSVVRQVYDELSGSRSASPREGEFAHVTRIVAGAAVNSSRQVLDVPAQGREYLFRGSAAPAGEWPGGQRREPKITSARRAPLRPARRGYGWKVLQSRPIRWRLPSFQTAPGGR